MSVALTNKNVSMYKTNTSSFSMKPSCLITFRKRDCPCMPSITVTAQKVFLFKVFLVRIFPHSDWIRRDTPSPYSFRMQENTDQKKSEYGHFSQCVIVQLNPCLANILFLYLLKTPENHRCSGVSRRYKTKALTKNRLSVGKTDPYLKVD